MPRHLHAEHVLKDIISTINLLVSLCPKTVSTPILMETVLYVEQIIPYPMDNAIPSYLNATLSIR